MKISIFDPKTRSVLLAMAGGMMAAAYLDTKNAVDLSFGFPPGGIMEGAAIAIIGAGAGYAVLYLFRKLKEFATRNRA